MGSNTSKVTNETAAKITTEDVSSDPRSPTPEISRTPLQCKNGAKHNITKNVDLRKTFESTNNEEKLIHNNPILSAVIKSHLLSYDPRSPTQDFDRTPIVIASKIDELTEETNLLRIQKEYSGSPVTSKYIDYEVSVEATEFSPELLVPKNLCNEFLDSTLNETFKDNEEPLGSSTASKDALEVNESCTETETDRRSTKLLETNFDFIPTEEIHTDNVNDVTPNSAQPIQEVFDKSEEQIKAIPAFKILEYDPRSPSIGIDRTPIVVPKNEKDESSDNVEEMSDDSLIKVLQNTNSELRQTVPKGQPTDMADGLLIYEDESADLKETPKKCVSVNNNGSRTPLSCMKNKADTGHERSKSANNKYDLKIQKVVSKIPKRISHIPRLKTLSKQSQLVGMGSSISLKNISKSSVMNGDCENTPPHSHRDIWDKDSSIVL